MNRACGPYSESCLHRRRQSDSIGKEQTKTATELAYAEIISYNRKNLERELQNESRQHDK